MVYIVLFALGAALVTLLFYLILNPRVLTTEGETFDLRFILFMLMLIVLAASTVALMLILGKMHHLL
ncbi:hypothetical protein CSW37_05140 [Thermus scotoductus]|uniref:Cytochrome oxidase Caa3-type subunit IV domain-containing protein n=1 Tax=Thermus scotoductus TaxID=37636 RepID=A0A430SFQ4_THESC|nr:hypothetical protein [Thermus scotoductus]RTH38138.1 hypothetical protein CSW37_05140 [Thermus scotoductus]